MDEHSSFSLRERMLQTTRKFLNAFNEFTPESMVAYRSPTCLHRLRPGSLNYPALTNAEYSAWARNLMSVMRGFELHFKPDYEPIVEEISRKVVLYLESTCETDLGRYENEYIWILRLDRNGTSIDEIIEFADSAYTLEWIEKLQKAAKQ